MATNCKAKQVGSVMRIEISIIILCLALSACTSAATTKTQENLVVHVVLVWLEEPGNQEHIQQVIDVSKQLKEIPDIQEMRVGRSISSDRKIVDDSFDVGLYMTFNSVDDMQSYLNNTEHIKAVTDVLKPISSKIRVYDFEFMGK